ncbi:hypothetical protein GGR32_001351 [Mesonia hippocampi]|uniref:Porin n=1 Tax=Mesonia hippocampi TaxID=1628250 RepID=A0A840EPP5_9FLAO|nr:putative porin [Mesonia hippocampi]MBB4119055.1 hypothetical protein [Mesonia hippocampi]
MIRTVYISICIVFFISETLTGQVLGAAKEISGERRGELGINEPSENMQGVIDKREKPPVTDYKIISVRNDTSYVDTTLTIYKHYKYNSIRKDDVELLPFANVGQGYTRLAHQFSERKHLPGFGTEARENYLYKVDDIHYYNVPTPLTELFFKTTFEQGQNLDAFLTSNIAPNINFSLAYKSISSLGKYQHTRTRHGNFRTTVNYQSKNNRYDLKTHFVSQSLTNQENGGLTTLSTAQYLLGSKEYKDRSVLDVNYNDAENRLLSKRFFLKHDFKLIQSDSISQQHLKVGHKLSFTDKEFRFTQARASLLYGNTYEDTDLFDETEFQNLSNTLYLDYTQKTLGNIQFFATHTNYRYGYHRKLQLDTGIIPNYLKGDVINVGGVYKKHLKGITLNTEAAYNVSGDYKGYYLLADANYTANSLFTLGAKINMNAHEASYTKQLYQSDYVNYNWYNDFKPEKEQHIEAYIKHNTIGSLSAQVSQLKDYTYFGYVENPAYNPNAQDNLEPAFFAKPFQYHKNIKALKLKFSNKLNYAKFSLENTLLYQNVLEGEEVYKVSDFITRNSLYYSDYWFDKALYLQTGVTFKYFTSFYADNYDAVIADYVVQNNTELEGFYTADLFFNAKVRQTRIYFTLENFPTIFTNNGNFTAQGQPYRDFVIRFGLVWNFFL